MTDEMPADIWALQHNLKQDIDGVYSFMAAVHVWLLYVRDSTFRQHIIIII